MSKSANADKAKGGRWWLKRLTLALLLFLLALEGTSRWILGDLAELGLLEFWPADGRSLGLRPGATASYNGYFLKIPEVTLTVNEFGYRGAPRPVAKPTGTYRVAIFGDSYTYGVGVEDDETSSVLLETLLKADGRDVEVLNFGIPGANIADLELQYPLFISRWQPDLLILQLSPNDLDRPMFTKDDPLDPNVVTGVFRHVYAARILLVGAFLVVTVSDAVFDDSERPTGEITREQLETLRDWIAKLTLSAERAGTEVSVVVLGNPVPGASMERVLATCPAATNATLDASLLLDDDANLIPNEGHFNALGHARLAELLFGLVGKSVPTGEAALPDTAGDAAR